MPSLLIRNVRVVEPGKSIRPGEVLVCDGVIVSVGQSAGKTSSEAYHHQKALKTHSD